jgi:P pilus assembly chaperone PapD
MMWLFFRPIKGSVGGPEYPFFHSNKNIYVPKCMAKNRRMKWASRYFSILSGLALLFMVVSESFAGSQLMVIPKRIVFSKNMRSAQVTIINSGDATGTFRISLNNKRMSLGGRLEDVKSAGVGELFADKIIRFSPRQVVLEPGKSQIVRLGLRKPSGLEDGEYRSHMLFQAIPLDVGKDIKESVKTSSGVTIKLTAIVGISIPIIVRHGKTEAEVSIVSAKFVLRQEKEDQPHILLEFERSGNRSVYGDLLAEFITKDGDRKIIAQVGGIAVYTPGTNRRFRLPIIVPPDLELRDGNIQVFYRSPMEQGGKVMAQKQIKIP